MAALMRSTMTYFFNLFKRLFVPQEKKDTKDEKKRLKLAEVLKKNILRRKQTVV